MYNMSEAEVRTPSRILIKKNGNDKIRVDFTKEYPTTSRLSRQN